MRADRLIALLLLLQRRGRVTAAQVAAELEVSPRTARRDLEALAMSGVPVYSTHGRGGGWELIGGASTDLSGLSADEARALFLAAGPAVTATPELKSALGKLTSALPAPFQAQAEAATTAFKIDPAGWGQVGQGARPPAMEQLTDAVIQGRQVEIDYQGQASKRRWRTVHPLGLVTKRSVWYLVAGVQGQGSDGTGRHPDHELDIRTYRVDRVHRVRLLESAVSRLPTFDLDDAWEGIVTEVERRLTTVRVEAIIDAQLLDPIRWVFGAKQVSAGAEPDRGGDGRLPVVIDAYSAASFAAQIAGFGDRVELVDAPTEVRAALADLVRQLHDRYGLPPAQPGEATADGSAATATAPSRPMT